MKLKPMDENTLAFLRELVKEYESTYDHESARWLFRTSAYFTEEGDLMSLPYQETIDAFAEAIKNADTHN